MVKFNIAKFKLRPLILGLASLVVFGALSYFAFFHTSAATSGKTVFYLHKERSDYNQTYNALALTPPEPAVDSATTSISNTLRGGGLCNPSGNTSDMYNVIQVDGTVASQTYCAGSFISAPVGQTITISTSDINSINLNNFWMAVGNKSIVAEEMVELYQLSGSTLTQFGTYTTSTTSSTTPVSTSTTISPNATLTLASTDRIVVRLTLFATTGHLSGQNNYISTYFDSTARNATSVSLKYTVTTPNKPTLTGPMDDDFTGWAPTSACSTLGVVYNIKWTCLQGSAANTAGAYNAEDTAAAGSGDSSGWLWLRNQETTNTATVSNFGATPSNTFLYQKLPSGYGNGSVQTVLNSTNTFQVDSASIGGSSPYSHSGLALWSSNSDYLELQVYSTSNSGSGTGGFTNSVNVALNNSGTLSGATSLNPSTSSGLYNEIWLGFTNANGSWQAQYSTNGSTWNNIGSPVNHSVFTRVGLNTFTAVASDANSYAGAFDWFQSTLATPTYSQTSYRWFQNADSTTPGSALAAQNTPLTLTTTGQNFRLRNLVKESGQNIVGSAGFDLQEAALGAAGSCSAVASTNYRSLDAGGKWNTATSPGWTQRYSFGSVVFNNKLWVMGGAYYDTGISNYVYLNDVWSSSDGVTWTQATANAGWTGRENLQVVVFNSKMWVIGGDANGPSANDVWSSSDGVTWTQATANAGWTTSYITAESFNSKIWVYGGQYNNNVWSSTDGTTWSQGTNASWGPRAMSESVVFNNKVWIMGGYSGSSSLNDVWSSTDGSTWTQVTSSAPWGSRSNFSLVASGTKLYVIGGDPSWGGSIAIAYSDVWSSTDGANWSKVDDGTSEWIHIKGSQSQYFSNNLWLMGGENDSNNVWRSVSAPITYFDNPSPSNASSISTTGSDPTDTGQSIAAQNYLEDTGIWNTQSDIGATVDGMWDFSLYDNGAPGGTSYCFRMVKSDKTALTTYTNYPQITTYVAGPTLDQVMRGGTWFNSSGVKQDKYWAH